ncbi:hypothetical protein YC2023_074263 [Brassica napus]
MARNEENPMAGAGQSSLESLMQRPVPVPPPGSYPVPNQEQARGDHDGGFYYNFGNLSIKDKKEETEITRNSLELLSSMLNTEGKPNHTEDELTTDETEKKASVVDQESSGPKPTEEEQLVKQKDEHPGETPGSSNKTGKEDKQQVKIELGLSSDEDEK